MQLSKTEPGCSNNSMLGIRKFPAKLWSRGNWGIVNQIPAREKSQLTVGGEGGSLIVRNTRAAILPKAQEPGPGVLSGAINLQLCSVLGSISFEGPADRITFRGRPRSTLRPKRKIHRPLKVFVKLFRATRRFPFG